MEDESDSGARFEQVRSYTEAKHTAYADVSGAPPVMGERPFTPTRITVHFGWRTQVNDGWATERIELSGPWLPAEGREPLAGSGKVILWPTAAPVWATAFAEANAPAVTLVEVNR